MFVSRKSIREKCPNIKFLRAFLSKLRIIAYEKELIPSDIIFKCIDNVELKKSVVIKYEHKWPERAKRIKEELHAFSEAEQLEPVDVLFANFAYGMRVDEYILFDFNNRSEYERSLFLSDKKYSELTVYMNDLFDGEVFWDKTKTFPRMKEYYKRDGLVLTKQTPIKTVETFIKKHPVFVKKIGASSFGNGVEKIDLSSFLAKADFKVDKLISKWLATENALLLEELINQSDEMAHFNPSSVNTVRIITFNTKCGVITPYAFLKNGRNGSFVDNGGAGGILIGIDARSGGLITDGVDEHRNWYKSHPDTGVIFRDKCLPEWDKAIDLCKKMALEIPSVKMVGWDLAHSQKGWILVEANERSQIVGPQLVSNTGLKNEIISIMRNMDLICPLR